MAIRYNFFVLIIQTVARGSYIAPVKRKCHFSVLNLETEVTSRLSHVYSKKIHKLPPISAKRTPTHRHISLTELYTQLAKINIECSSIASDHYFCFPFLLSNQLHCGMSWENLTCKKYWTICLSNIYGLSSANTLNSSVSFSQHFYKQCSMRPQGSSASSTLHTIVGACTSPNVSNACTHEEWMCPNYYFKQPKH